MSSILKALQRLQGERGGAGEPQPALRDDLARELRACSDRVRPGEVRAFPSAPQGTGTAKGSGGSSSR